jgi:hypothetical protein
VSIELPAEEVRALGRALEERAGAADEVRVRLRDHGDVEGALRAPVALLLEGHSVLADALAAELRHLGATVTDVAAAWTELDAGLLPAGAGTGAP